MSLVYITNHDEVIYDVVDSRDNVVPKSKNYPNYLDLAFKDSITISKKKHATMGPAEYVPPNPQEFLRKNTNTITTEYFTSVVRNKKTQNILVDKDKPDKSNKFERCCCCCKTKQEKRPPIPTRKYYKPREQNKNFVKENVKNMIKLKPRQPEENTVLTKHGDKVPANILEPQYVRSKKFGKFPRYLLKIQHQTGKLLETINDEREMNQISNCRYVTRQERDALLDGLKQNWDEKQKEFQLLPMITDTIPKRNRKLLIEKELKVLEKDILLIEKHPYLYIMEED